MFWDAMTVMRHPLYIWSGPPFSKLSIHPNLAGISLHFESVKFQHLSLLTIKRQQAIIYNANNNDSRKRRQICGRFGGGGCVKLYSYLMNSTSQTHPAITTFAISWRCRVYRTIFWHIIVEMESLVCRVTRPVLGAWAVGFLHWFIENYHGMR